MSAGKEPDWDKLSVAAEEASRLHEAGILTKEKYGELLEQAEEACNGYTEFLECIINFEPRR